MRPISDINIGDQYQRGFPYDLTWSVIDIDKSEKLIKLQAFNSEAQRISRPLWKKNSDKLFNYRIYNGATNEMELV